MRTILFLGAVILLNVAGAQNKITAYEYWFNGNTTGLQKQNITPVQTLQLNTLVSTNGLKDGLHLLNMRFKDDSGRYSPAITQFFYKVPEALTPSNAQINTMQYWFNQAYASSVTENLSASVSITLDRLLATSSLNDGLHLFNLRFRDNRGLWSPVVSHFFYKTAPTPSPSTGLIRAYQYWFNQSQGTSVTENISQTATYSLQSLISATSLPDGLHLFNLRFNDNRGVWSPVVSHFFYKAPTLPSPGTNLIKSYQYWFNTNTGNAVTQQIAPVSPYQLSGNLDLSALKPGVHLLHIRFADQRGLWSPVVSQFVYIAPPLSPTQNAMDKMQYWFNGQFNEAGIISLPKQPVVQLTEMLETSNLADGLHMLHMRFADTTGKWSPAITQFFYKSKEFGITNNVITGYRYWFNDAPAEQIAYHRITAANPFNMITVLDMGCLANGDNRLMMQFRDSAGQWSAPMVDTISVTAPADKTLRFIGNGNWSNSANWKDGMKPAPDAPNCREIIIDHVSGGICILDVPQTMLKNSKLIVMPGKKLIVPSIEATPQQLEPDY
jgi:hypothetical protein